MIHCISMPESHAMDFVKHCYLCFKLCYKNCVAYSGSSHLDGLDCRTERMPTERKLPMVSPRVREKLNNVPVRSLLQSNCSAPQDS